VNSVRVGQNCLHSPTFEHSTSIAIQRLTKSVSSVHPAKTMIAV